MTVREDRHAEIKPTETGGLTVEEGVAASAPDTASQTQPMDIDPVPAATRVDLVAAAPNHDDNLSGQCATYTPAIIANDKPSETMGSDSPVETRDELPAIIDLDDSDDYEPPEPKVDERVAADLPLSNVVPAETAIAVPQRRNMLAETASEVHVV